MEETKTPVSEPCDEQGLSGCTEITQGSNPETSQPIDPHGSRTDSHPRESNHCDAWVEHLNARLDNVSNRIKKFSEQLSLIVQQAEQLKAADSVIAELSTRCRSMSEQFYEREVLLPVIHSLISIADRIRQQIAKSKNIRDKYSDGQNRAEAKVLTYLLDGRNADLMELEDALANLGVESYHNPQNMFEPSTQKCINYVECDEQVLTGRIAYRLLPGYERHGQIIRKEYVNVYAVKETLE
jgi:molecular chaperone GrpE (heat shock protein)